MSGVKGGWSRVLEDPKLGLKQSNQARLNSSRPSKLLFIVRVQRAVPLLQSKGPGVPLRVRVQGVTEKGLELVAGPTKDGLGLKNALKLGLGGLKRGQKNSVFRLLRNQVLHLCT